jgi:DNA-directed RNA polymerase specialized sigma24 family protein
MIADERTRQRARELRPGPWECRDTLWKRLAPKVRGLVERFSTHLWGTGLRPDQLATELESVAYEKFCDCVLDYDPDQGPGADLRAWLCKVLEREFFDWHRHNRRERPRAPGEIQSLAPSPDGGPVEALEHEEEAARDERQLAAIRAALGGLLPGDADRHAKLLVYLVYENREHTREQVEAALVQERRAGSLNARQLAPYLHRSQWLDALSLRRVTALLRQGMAQGRWLPLSRTARRGEWTLDVLGRAVGCWPATASRWVGQVDDALRQSLL